MLNFKKRKKLTNKASFKVIPYYLKCENESEQEFGVLYDLLHVIYITDRSTLLQKLYLHKKIALLVQHGLVIEYNGRKISWRHEYPETRNHLQIEQRNRQEQIINTPYPIYYDHLFAISITN
jgi:hypothetical protein